MAVVEIENTIHHVDFKVSDIKSMRALMFFRSLKGTDKHDVVRGAWVNSYECWLDLRVGQALQLIVAVRDRADGLVRAVQADYVDPEYDPEQTFDPHFKVLKDPSYNVMVQLISGTGKEERLVGRFSFKLTVRPVFGIKRI